MIKFDLEKALAGEKVVTRDGREVAQLVRFKCSIDETYPVTCVLDGMIERYRDSGGYSEINQNHCSDLFMAPKKLSGFVNIYIPHGEDEVFTVHCERRHADKVAGSSRVACIDLSQFEQGYGI
ncbi:MAG: hypothetical protein COA78_21100 [Blastopirellula sp.]|nr:MAG: hypothetical protein COA78_21100 [Blastopirellula sp.]